MNKKKIAVIVSVIVVICVIVGAHFGANRTVSGMENYKKNYAKNPDYIHFTLSEVGEYNEVYYQSATSGNLLFKSRASMLTAKYSAENFKKQNEANEYLHYQENEIKFDGEHYALPQTEFTIGKWSFRVLESRSSNWQIPKSIDFIAVNKDERKIAYMTFYDQDLDYICSADEADGYMEKFVNKYFKYDFGG